MGNTASPSSQPSHVPTFIPTSSPSVSHTPTYKPSKLPTFLPSFKPSLQPTFYPTVLPSYSCEPTYSPSTYIPTTSSPTNFIGWTHVSMMKLKLDTFLGACATFFVLVLYCIISRCGKKSYQRIPEQPEIEVDPPDITSSSDNIELKNTQEQRALAHEQIKEMEININSLKNQLVDGQQLRIDEVNALKRKLAFKETQISSLKNQLVVSPQQMIVVDRIKNWPVNILAIKKEEDLQISKAKNEDNIRNEMGALERNEDYCVIKSHAIDMRSLITKEKDSQSDNKFELRFKFSLKNACNSVIHFYDTHAVTHPYPVDVVRKIRMAWPTYLAYKNEMSL